MKIFQIVSMNICQIQVLVLLNMFTQLANQLVKKRSDVTFVVQFDSDSNILYWKKKE